MSNYIKYTTINILLYDILLYIKFLTQTIKSFFLVLFTLVKNNGYYDRITIQNSSYRDKKCWETRGCDDRRYGFPEYKR